MKEAFGEEPAAFSSSRPDSHSSTGPWPGVRVEGDLRRASREWIHTNGAGAYASSTLACMHNRRYHGLLVAALDPPRGRHVFLSHVDVTATFPRATAPMSPISGRGPASSSPRSPLDVRSWELAKHQFPGVDPESGPFYLQRFDQDPVPRWTYAVAEGELEVSLALVRGENAAVLRYAWRGSRQIQLTLRPLLAARSFHTLQREHGGMLQRVELRAHEGAGEMRVQPRRELPRICFRYEGTFVGSPDWWHRFEYLREQERGLDYIEDLWTPGVFEVRLDDRPGWLVAAVDKLPSGDPEALFEGSRAALLAQDPGPGASMLERRLSIASDAFRADLAKRPGILAGYPWFEVWGRAALIALPGLYLVPGKLDGAMRVVRELLGAMRDGIVPNRIPEAGEAIDYQTADATLWLFEAARLLVEALGAAHPFVSGELFPALRAAFEAALRGTKHGIHVTPDGLFAAAAAGEALTWMDARVAGAPVTPRAGCPVELSALWARGCDTLSRLADAAGDEGLEARAAAERDRTRAAFQARFWCEETSYPYDVISEAPAGPESSRDASVRPNAVIALAIDPECFTPERAAAVLARAERELVTPAGLRTLSPSDPRYVGRYAGAAAERDAAYHQGTVWPWLVGFYVRAARRLADEQGLARLDALVASAAGNELAMGQVPEIACGDAPHDPAGCAAQAFSVAELYRAAAWDLRRS